VGVLRRAVAAVKGTVWLTRPSGLRQQIDYVEKQLDGFHGLFDQWEARFSELFARFEQQAQAVLPDVLERQQQMSDKLSQMNSGFGAREARLTKWLADLHKSTRQMIDELKHQEAQIARLHEVLGERPLDRPDVVAGIGHDSESLTAHGAIPGVNSPASVDHR
jgi:hypothetical protein